MKRPHLQQCFLKGEFAPVASPHTHVFSALFIKTAKNTLSVYLIFVSTWRNRQILEKLKFGSALGFEPNRTARPNLCVTIMQLIKSSLNSSAVQLSKTVPNKRLHRRKCYEHALLAASQTSINFCTSMNKFIRHVYSAHRTRREAPSIPSILNLKVG